MAVHWSYHIRRWKGFLARKAYSLRDRNRSTRFDRRAPAWAVRVAAETIADDWYDEPNYYNDAESWVDLFWKNDSQFKRMFAQLDTQDLVELACGRGRHSWAIRDMPGQKILVDVIPRNIQSCRERFKDYSNVSFFVNDGFSLADIAANSVSGLFSYDAMVHFDHTVVFSYLMEINRILKPGGRAVLHHSNYGENPGGDYRTNPEWRNFMTRDLFSEYCSKSRLIIKDQTFFAWGDNENIDCLSLIEKPLS